MTYGGARAEASVERFGDESHLSVGAKILMAFAEGFEDGCGGGKASDNLVIGAGDVLKHEGFEGPIVGFLGTVAFGIGRDVRLREGPIEPIGESMPVRDQRHLEAPFFPIGPGAIEAEIFWPGSFSYELHGGEMVAGPKRGNGGQLGSLVGRRGRSVRTRAQGRIVGRRGRVRSASCPQAGTGASRVACGGHSTEEECPRGDLVRVFAGTKLKGGP